MFREITEKGLDWLFGKLIYEMEGLKNDLIELSKVPKEKRDYLFIESVYMIDRYLDWVIETAMGFAINGSYPKKYQDLGLVIIDNARALRDFIDENFRDDMKRFSVELSKYSSLSFS